MMSSMKGPLIAVVAAVAFLVTLPLVISAASDAKKATTCPTASTTAIDGSATLSSGATHPVTISSTTFLPTGTTSYAPGVLCATTAAIAASVPAGTRTGYVSGTVWDASQMATLASATKAGAIFRYAFPNLVALLDIVVLAYIAGGIGLAGMAAWRRFKPAY